MEMREYQNAALKYAIYPKDRLCTYAILGLCSEAGEVADKIKKIIRDEGGIMNGESKKELMKELGDVLWYVSSICSDFGVELGTVAQANLEKLQDRADRMALKGSGDNR